MKKIFLTTILFFFILSMNAQIVNIPDANFKNALISEGVDTNNDGEIQESEAASTIELHLSNQNISSMEGIEYFLNLKFMYCTGNQIEILDLSSNVHLEFLHCNDNQITYLDVSNSLELDELECASNQLTNLDISQNSNLDRLHCGNNLLTSLDISPIANLRSFHCPNNNLTSLITGSVNIEWFSCNNNYLSYVDVSQNLNLRGYNCSGNLFSSIDVSNNLNLEDLDISNNQILNLDVSPNQVLRRLDCESNNLINLNVSNGINFIWYEMHATNNPNLYCIQVDDETFTPSFCDQPNGNGWCKDITATYSEECILGITNLDLDNINIYPNPVQNTLKIITEFPIDNIKIYTLQGQLINETINDKIDVSLLSSGLYFVVLIIDEKISVKKFIKN